MLTCGYLNVETFSCPALGVLAALAPAVASAAPRISAQHDATEVAKKTQNPAKYFDPRFRLR